LNIPLSEALKFWAKLGFISFGGPAGQIAVLHQELVEKRRWISERRFLHALNYCMLLPGPEAQQLVTYIGWLMHRTWGGILAGTLFVLPSLFILIGLSWVYLAYGQVPWIAAIFFGIKPAVTAIVLHAAVRIGKRTLHNQTLQVIALCTLLPRNRKTPLGFSVVVAMLAIAFYPLALGYGMFDPYAWGYGTLGLLIAVVVFALICGIAGWVKGVWLLSLAIIAWSFHWHESTNLWDYILDPFLAVWSIYSIFHFFYQRRRQKLQSGYLFRAG
jgi:chromate transport protein ChrA